MIGALYYAYSVAAQEKPKILGAATSAATLAAVLGVIRWQRCSESWDWHLRPGSLREGTRASSAVVMAGRFRPRSHAPSREIAAGVSFGVAGGLAPKLHAGTCVVGSVITSGTTRFMTDWNWSRNLLQAIPSAVYGAIVGVSAPMAQPEAKRALHVSTGALAVDMESHVVASVAAARALPMAAVRVITDSATRELPPVALAAMRANGSIDIAALLRSMMKETSELPMLLLTALDAMIGLTALLRCRQFLGPSFGLPD